MSAVTQALTQAIAASAEVRGTTSPNPPVGAAIISATGEIVGVGATEPAGGAHAEIKALQQAGAAAHKATAVVTLEPCNHTGRTGPCTQALVAAGIGTVYYVHSDPNPVASGGAQWLRDNGVTVIQMEGTVAPLLPWLKAAQLRRPHITWKTAQTLDGFTAALDGSSQWITGEAARANVHLDRSKRDAIIVGAGTFAVDKPRLTARRSDGGLYPHQPRRVVIGSRDITAPGWEHYRSIDEALDTLWQTGARDVLLEGGAQLASAFISRSLIDAARIYLAPTLLGGGLGTLAEPLGTTIADVYRFQLDAVTPLGDDLLVELSTLPVL